MQTIGGPWTDNRVAEGVTGILSRPKGGQMASPDESGSKAAVIDDLTIDDRPDLTADHVLDAISDSVMVLSPDWRFTYVNRAALERARLLREQVIGRSLWELGWSSPVDIQPVRAAAAEGKPLRFDQPA